MFLEKDSGRRVKVWHRTLSTQTRTGDPERNPERNPERDPVKWSWPCVDVYLYEVEKAQLSVPCGK